MSDQTSLKACRWIQKPAHNHQTQSQRVKTSLKYREKLRKPKQRKNQCRAQIFQYTLQTDLLGEEGVTTHEKTNLLSQHLQTRRGHRKPHAVHSVPVLQCNLRFQISVVVFDRCKPFDSNSYRRIGPISKQHSLCNDRTPASNGCAKL